MAGSIPLIIDVDTGIDDAFGLLYALAQPSVRLIGVASVAGNVDLAKATRNTRAVLADLEIVALHRRFTMRSPTGSNAGVRIPAMGRPG